jgi:hypothetical protein
MIEGQNLLLSNLRRPRMLVTPGRKTDFQFAANYVSYQGIALAMPKVFYSGSAFRR